MQKSSKNGLVFAVYWAVSTVGCGAAPVECGDQGCEGTAHEPESNNAATPVGDERVGSVSQALTVAWATGPIAWKQGDPQHAVLATRADNICILTKVGGHFRGGGESVHVYEDGENWRLGGTSQQAGVNGEAHCFPRNGFIGANANRAVSSRYTLSIAGDCSTKQGDLYNSDAFSFLEGLKGNMAGGGEYARTIQSVIPGNPNNWQGQSCTGSTLTAYARNFRVGPIEDRLARMIGSEYTVSGDLGHVRMAKVSEAMCAFTRLQGEFRGGGEWAQIRKEQDPVRGQVWALATRTQTDSGNIRASARCFARDQTL